MVSLIQNGASVNHANEDGKTPLRWAATKGHKEVVEYLVEQGANVNYSDVHGDTPLLWAARLGYKEVVECLIQHGASVVHSNEAGADSEDAEDAEAQAGGSMYHVKVDILNGIGLVARDAGRVTR